LLRTITGQGTAGVTFDTPIGIAYSTAAREVIVADLADRVVRIPDSR
jgi:hypothetical protein